MRVILPLLLIALAVAGRTAAASAEPAGDPACDAALAVLRDYARDGEKMFLVGANRGFEHPLSELEKNWRTMPPTALLQAYRSRTGTSVRDGCAGRRAEIEALGFEFDLQSWNAGVDQSASVNVAILDETGSEALVQSSRAFRKFGGHCLLSYLRRENGEWKIIDQRPICVV